MTVVCSWHLLGATGAPWRDLPENYESLLQSLRARPVLRDGACALPQDDERVGRAKTGTISARQDYFPATGRSVMARKYSKKASAKVERAMKKRKAGTLKSGRSGRKVRSRKQAIAIGLSEARREGKKVPKKAAKKRKTAKKRKAKRERCGSSRSYLFV